MHPAHASCLRDADVIYLLAGLVVPVWSFLLPFLSSHLHDLSSNCASCLSLRSGVAVVFPRRKALLLQRDRRRRRRGTLDDTRTRRLTE